MRAGPFAVRFGANLAYCRQRADISQEGLGMRSELHRTAVGQLERGHRIARADTLVKLAGSLGIHSEELLDGLLWTPSIRTAGAMAIEPFAGQGSGQAVAVGSSEEEGARRLGDRHSRLALICAWTFGAIALRLAGGLIALAGLLGLSLAGNPSGILVVALGGCLWLAGHLHFRLRHGVFKSALAERLCLTAASVCRRALEVARNDRPR